MDSVPRLLPLFSIDDLFAVGLGFDIAGATLLAKGLLISPLQLHRRAATGYGISAGAYAGLAEDFADAVFGASSLVLGFLFQLAGYGAVIAGSNAATSGGRAAPALVLAVVVIALVAAVWSQSRLQLVQQRLMAVSGVMPGIERSQFLRLMGEEIGRPKSDGETDTDYATRVWGLEE